MTEAPTSQRVLVIGTRHAYQYGSGSSYIVPCSPSDEAKFRAYATETAARFAVTAIAEELNEEALAEHGKGESVLQQVAAHLRLKHCFCEPSNAERAALDVYGQTYLRAIAVMQDWTEAQIEGRRLADFEKRENVWCNRVEELDSSPVLFFCGADHAETFPALLRRRGLSPCVLQTCWEA